MAAISGPNIPLDGLVFNMDPASNLSYPARNDPYRDQISLLLDGTILTDKSRNNYTITANGNASIVSNTTFENVYSFDGNGDYLTLNSNSFTFGTLDFTIDMWVYPTQSVIGCGLLSEIFTGSGRVELSIFTGVTGALGTNYQLGVGHYNGSSWQYVINSGTTLTNNQWSHIRVTRFSGTLYLFINGSLVGSGSFPVDIGAGNGWLLARRWDTYSSAGQWPYYYGYMSNIVVWKGVCLGISNFTPSSRIVSLPAIIKDVKNDIVGTFTNGPVFSNVQKGAISFDGSDDYIIIPGNSNLAFGTSDFAIELWFKTRNKTSLYPNIIGTNSAWAANVWSLTDRHASLNPTKLTLHVYNIGNNVLVSNTAIQNNTWYHLVITRIGNNFYMYLNGALESTYISSNSFDGGVSNNIAIGIANNSTNAYDGSIPYLRVYKNRGFTLSDVLKNYNATRERFVEIPKTISGLQLWLDAADLSTLRQNSNGTTAVVASSDPIGYWADKSGNGRNVLQATSSYRPVFAAGVKGLFPGVTFDGVDDFLESTASGATSIVDSTLIMVARWNDVSGTDTPVVVGRGYTGGGEVRAFYRPSGTTKFSWGTWNGDLGTTTIDVGQNTFNIFAATQAGNQIRLYKNYSYNSYTYGNTPASPTYNQWDIGGPNNGYNQYAGITIGEVLIFNRSLEYSEMLTLLAYLNGKWGVV